MNDLNDLDFSGWLMLGALLFILVFGAPTFWVFSAFQEAAAYNRVTGEAVTTWDALWIELRVVSCQ